VDDGSKDRTCEVVEEWRDEVGEDRLRLLKLPANQGKGGAVQQGMLHARGRYLLFADADGASEIEDFGLLEEQIKKIENRDGFGVVVGSRAHMEKDSVAQRKCHRTVLMYGFHFFVYALFQSHIRDTQCGFKLFTRDVARWVSTRVREGKGRGSSEPARRYS